MASNTAELNGVKCPICLGPTFFKSRSCRSFLNHIRTCRPSHSSEYLQTTNRGIHYDTRSLIQSNFVGDLYNIIDYDTGSNDNYFEMGDCLTDTNEIIEENINVQPSLVFQVEMRNIINRHAAPLGMYDELINLMNNFWMSNS